MTRSKNAPDREPVAASSLSQQDLTQSRAFLDSLIENLPLMIFVKDARELRFVRFNKAGEDLVGHSRKELIGKNDFDFFPREQAERFIANDRAVLGGRAIIDIPEEKITSRHRGERLLHTRKIPLFGIDGRPEYLLGISEDITERKQAEKDNLRLISEEAAYKERERLAGRTALLAEASAVLASTLDYRDSLNRLAWLVVPEICDWCTMSIQKEEHTFERVVTIHCDPSMQQRVSELREMNPVHPSHAGGVGDVIASGRSHRYSPITDEQLRGESANESHYELLKEIGVRNYMIVPIKARDRVLGAMAFFNSGAERTFDIEDQYLAEELGRRAGMTMENALLYEKAQRAIQARDEFLSIASHELKTPVTSLKMQLQMTRRNIKPELGQSPTPEKLVKVLETSTIQVDRLTRLIEELLDVSRIQGGKVSFDFEELDLSALIRDVIDRYTDSLEAASCGIELDLEDAVIAVADRGRIEQVLVNLFSNAIKYAPGTPLQIRLSRQDGVARIEVEDRGPGIDPREQSRIFERFERAGSSRNISGLGLGLFITKEIVQGHGGSIELESAPGQGSRFIISLPLKRPGLPLREVG